LLSPLLHLISILQRFRSSFSEYKDKKLYGILAAVDLSPELREKFTKKAIPGGRLLKERSIKVLRMLVGGGGDSCPID
jgi:hypothetical protein